jgi:hypothetical protein
MVNFNYRGDVKISKKTGEFAPVIPYTFENSDIGGPASPDLDCLIAKVSSLRTTYQKLLKLSKPR